MARCAFQCRTENPHCVLDQLVGRQLLRSKEHRPAHRREDELAGQFRPRILHLAAGNTTAYHIADQDHELPPQQRHLSLARPGPHRAQELVHIRPGRRELHQPGDDQPQLLFAGPMLPGKLLMEASDQARRAVADQRNIQILFAPEVDVDGPLADARLGRHFIELHLMEGLCGKEPLGHLEDLTAFVRIEFLHGA